MFDLQQLRIKIDNAYRYLSRYIQKDTYDLLIYLGSGFDPLIELFEIHQEVPFAAIPGFPRSTVLGHRGQLSLASYQDHKIILMRGRFHYYEGYPMHELSLPIRVFARFGLKKIILTNAAGGIHPDFDAGQLVIIKDHINGSHLNPLIGPNLDEFGPRFQDMTETYHPTMIDAAQNSAAEIGVNLKQGVYYYTPGPSFETPAEIRMMAHLGADLVGMSTVPEAIVARHSGFDIFGLSFVANKAAGLHDDYLEHQDVLDSFKDKVDTIKQFFDVFLPKILL